MKKTYIKPEMMVYQISKRSMLLANSSKGVYGKIDAAEQVAITFGGYVTEAEEEEIDPD